jgi:hypothetical protein
MPFTPYHPSMPDFATTLLEIVRAMNLPSMSLVEV